MTLSTVLKTVGRRFVEVLANSGGGTYIDTSIWAMGGLVEVEPDVILFIYQDSWFKTLRAQYTRVTDRGLEPVRDGSPPHLRRIGLMEATIP